MRRGEPDKLLPKLLDSLGYFGATWDTVARDTVVVHGGPRTGVDSITLRTDHPFTIDSIGPVEFPFAYDTGKIQALVRRVLTFFARRGYPYARVSLSISDTECAKVASATENAPPAVVITFRVVSGRRCLFSVPRFMGELRTDRRILAGDVAFRPGQVFDVRVVECTRRRLLSRPYINDVHPAEPRVVLDAGADDTTFSPGGPVDRVVIPFAVEDNFGLGIDGMAAYQSEAISRWSGLMEISLLNILHKGESATLRYRGEKDLQQFDLTVAKPHIFLLPLFWSAGFGLEVMADDYGYLHAETEILAQLRGQWQAGVALKGHEASDSSESSRRFFGLDLVLRLAAEPHRAGVPAHSLDLTTGTGLADCSRGRYYRWHLDFDACSHVPLAPRHGFVGRIVANTIAVQEGDELHLVEKYRIGGHGSLRGYAEKEFPFSTVAYVQTEYLLYFSALGAGYIFLDGGVGFPGRITRHHSGRTCLLGFGTGIRVPVRVGRLSIAWARNYREKRGFGRIHVRIRNNLSSRK